jgi:hypothetical protein
MKEDLSRFELDVGKVVEETTPELVKERRRKAVQKLVDAGMIERETPPPAADAAVRVSAASPWAKDGVSAEIDAAELPSALMPAAAPAEERPVTKAARQAVKAGWHWSQPRKVIAVCAVVGVAMPVLVLLAGHMKETGTAASATALPSTGPGVAAPPSTGAGAAAVPSVTVSPTTTADRPPPPTASAAPSATTMPSATVAPTKPHGKASTPAEQPDAGAVAPLPTAEPATPAVPPAKPPTEDKPVF